MAWKQWQHRLGAKLGDELVADRQASLEHAPAENGKQRETVNSKSAHTSCGQDVRTLAASNCDGCYESAKQGVLTRAQDLFCEAGEVWFFNAEGLCC